jgi:sugar phosphate permease
MSLSTVGGVLAVVGSYICAHIIMMKGVRIVSVVTLIVTGAAIVLLGSATSIVVYAISIALFHIMGQGYCNVGTNTIIGNWYPVRKGFILGITTMGLPLASFAFVPLLAATFNSVGPNASLTVIGIVIAVFGVITWFWVRDTPQEVGLFPDNGKYPNKQQAFVLGKSQWTFGKLIRNKNAIFISLAYGLLFLVTQAMVSQTVPYLIEQGFKQPQAVATLSMAAGFGIIGSFIWGVIDDRISTKFASILYAIWYIITFIILFFPVNTVMIYIGIIMLGTALGGIGNLQPSMVITAFGSAEFPSVNRIINSLVAFIRAFAFLAMALGLMINGTYRFAVVPLIILTVIALIFVLGITNSDQPETAKNGAVVIN